MACADPVACCQRHENMFFYSSLFVLLDPSVVHEAGKKAQGREIQGCGAVGEKQSYNADKDVAPASRFERLDGQRSSHHVGCGLPYFFYIEVLLKLFLAMLFY